ncbi:MAG: hypothetical protein RH917_19510 [Lacipirellulaceae bacterium]
MPETTIQNQPQANSSVENQRPGELTPSADLVDYVKEYAREKPEVAALWCLGIGFVLGWKLKPW